MLRKLAQYPLQKLTGPTTATVENNPSLPPRERFFHADEFRPAEKADFVIVGAGAGGGPLAARLAEGGKKVVVLEAGDGKMDLSKRHELVETIPVFHSRASEDPATSVATPYFVKHFSDDARGQQDPLFDKEHGGLLYPRGAGFGGSTRVNAHIFVRADEIDWDSIAKQLDDPSWSAAQMRQHFTALEKNEYQPVLQRLHQLGRTIGFGALQNRGGHGFDGWLETTRADPLLLLRDPQLLLISAETARFAQDELGTLGDKLLRPLNLFDPNHSQVLGTQGLALTPTTITQHGERAGVRERLFDAAEKHEGLTLVRGAQVDKVELDAEQRATGVTYLDSKGQPVTVEAEQVVLSAGAFGTPEILMRSGIGDKDELAKAGVASKVHLPGVGKSLSDRYEVTVVTRMKTPFKLLEGVKFDPALDDPQITEWKHDRTGVYATNGGVISFQAKSRPDLKDPDLYIHGLPVYFRGYKPGYSTELVKDDGKYWTWLIISANKSDRKGEVKLDPANPRGNAQVNFMYHSEESEGDSAPLLEGVKLVRRINEKLSHLIESEEFPGQANQTDAQLRDYVETHSFGHHANGSARLGADSDPMAVLDSSLHVRGTQGLSVVDASIFPDNPGTFVVGPVLTVAEKAAADFLKER